MLLLLLLLFTASASADILSFERYMQHVKESGNPQIDAADGCTSIVVGKKASEDGSTINTHTNDCIDCDWRLARVPARDFEEHAMRPVYPARFQYPRYVGTERGPIFHKENLMEGIYDWQESKPIGHIPQVRHTYSYLDGGYAIQNEHQLTFGESTCGAKLTAVPIHAGGKAMFDLSALSRVAMERCRTARCAIQTMGDLAVKYGYYGVEWEGFGAFGEGGEMLAVNDPNEAWVFHILADDTGASAVWAAQRVPDDHVAVVANGFTIKQVDLNDKDNFMASENLHAVAIRAGLWDPKQHGEFNFQTVYGMDVSVYHIEYIARRQWRVYDLVAPSLKLRANATSEQLPFSVKVDKLVKVQDVFRFNRDHYEGTPYSTTEGLLGGPFGNPNRYDMYGAGGGPVTPARMATGHMERPISMFRTSYSIVSQARSFFPDEIGGRVWFSFHAPHGSVYNPFYGASSQVPDSFSRGSLFKMTHDSAWWAFCAVSNYAEREYRYIIQDVQEAQHYHENRVMSKITKVEEHAAHLIKSHQVKDAMEHLSTFTANTAEDHVQAWWSLFWHLLGRYHDGYRLDTPHAETIAPTKLFYPEWWLEKAGFWTQPKGDVAYGILDKEGDGESPKARQHGLTNGVAAAVPVHTSVQSHSSSLWAGILLGAVLMFGAGLAVGRKTSVRSTYSHLE